MTTVADGRRTLRSNAIEEIILRDDQRGVSALRPHLVPGYCADAARFVLEHSGATLIATGFYILSGQAVETDGPPGAVAIGRALERLGRTVGYVTDRHGAGVMGVLAGADAPVIEFPVAGPEESDVFARDLLARYEPALLIAIERCAPSADGRYRNMRSLDISEHTARVDRLFDFHEHTIGIGDGGNEIGMGLLAGPIAGYPKLPDLPAATACSKLVIASVSNWGAYGLLAALSLEVGRDLLPTVEEEAEWVSRCVAAGAVDGFSGEAVERVDGFDIADYGATLGALRSLLADAGIA